MTKMDMKRIIETFERKGFKVSFFESGGEAVKYLCSRLRGKSVGIGGSMTVEQLGLYDALSAESAVYWHWKQPADEAREKAAIAQAYISSANAIAATGEIVNIDGNGNRVASLSYGHEEVYIVAGVNKLTEELDSAIFRARNVAAPLNARRRGHKTPCAAGEELRCHDCSSPERGCRVTSIISCPPNCTGVMELVLINEKLGF